MSDSSASADVTRLRRDGDRTLVLAFVLSVAGGAGPAIARNAATLTLAAVLLFGAATLWLAAVMRLRSADRIDPALPTPTRPTWREALRDDSSGTTVEATLLIVVLVVIVIAVYTAATGSWL